MHEKCVLCLTARVYIIGFCFVCVCVNWCCTISCLCCRQVWATSALRYERKQQRRGSNSGARNRQQSQQCSLLHFSHSTPTVESSRGFKIPEQRNEVESEVRRIGEEEEVASDADTEKYLWITMESTSAPRYESRVCDMRKLIVQKFSQAPYWCGIT